MNRYAFTLGALTTAIGALLSLQASAATIQKFGVVPAAGSCQGALPSYEGSFRKRPLAVVNEGTTGAFLTCGVRGYASAQYDGIEAVATNRTAVATNMSCTLVDGVIDATLGFANYYPQTVNIGAGTAGFFNWTGPFTLVAISCNVPAKFEVNLSGVAYQDEIGA